MNKLLLNQMISINKDGFYFLELDNSLDTFEICVNKNIDAKILVFGENIDVDMQVSIMEGAHLFLEMFGVDLNFKGDFKLKEYGASASFCYSMLSSVENKLKLDVYHLAESTKSNVINHIVHKGLEKSFVEVDAYVPKGSKNSIVKQDNKIILLDNGKGEILPNLYVSEFDSFLEHSAYVAKFSKEELFYLKSRGISDVDANFLLMKSFLLGNMELEEEEQSKFIEKIQEFRR